MARDPNHPGANHYYIHAVEASNKPDRALVQAGRLETLVPGAGHLVHMPAHTYIRTGQYVKSAQVNANAAAVDEKYIAATGANGLYPMMYYTHNVQFESAAAMFAGNFAQAHAAALRTVKFVDPIADQMVMIEPFAVQDLTVLVRFGQWQPILQARPPVPTRLMQTALYHFARGAALAATGKAAEAEADLAAMKAAAAKIPKDVCWDRRILPAMSPLSRSPISPRASRTQRVIRPARSRDSPPPLRWKTSSATTSRLTG
jgi:hypothetical protein